MASVAVTGARGKTGKAVVGAVRAAGLDAVEARRPYEFPRVDAVYCIAPNLHPDEPALVASAIEAARSAGAHRFVYHSVAWPYAPEMPHHRDKAEAERLVRSSGLDWTILQPCAYLQNFAGALAGSASPIELPYDPDAPFAFVDVGDVAAIAAAVLADTDGRHRSATYELGGPERLSVRQLAAVCGARHDVRIDVRQISLEQWRRGSSLSAEENDRLAAMFAFYDSHGFAVGGAVTDFLLGRPARTLADVMAAPADVPAPADVDNSAGPVGQSSISPPAGGRS